MKYLSTIISIGILGLFPAIAAAHEVYVLDAATISKAMSMGSVNPFSAIRGNELEFIFWAFISLIVVSTVFAVTMFRLFEKHADPLLRTLKPFALPIVRITVGLCVVAFAYTGNIFGSELLLSTLFGSATAVARVVLAIMGLMLVAGTYTREVGIALVALYAYACFFFGTYLLTYTDFLGAFAVLAILGGGKFSIGKKHDTAVAATLLAPLRQFAFPFLRISLGWGTLFAAVYAKFLHAQLALEVVVQYDLTRYFPFDPLFVVLGALIIEFLAGTMLFFGIAIRWTLLFLAFWLTLSLLYFQEMIWPHGILFGLAIALFCHGYDRYSLQGWLFRKQKYESVL